MTPRLVSSGLRAAFVAGLIALAPAPQVHTQGDRAREMLAQAVDRLGGVEALRASATWLVEGTGTEDLSAEVQGLAPGSPTIRPHFERVAANANRGAVAWERRTPRNDMSLRWRRFIWREDSTGIVVWTDSAGSMNANVIPEPRRRAMLRRIPHLMLLEAATRGEGLALGAERRVGGYRLREVRVTFRDSLRASLWLDADSSLLRATEYRAFLPGRGDVVVRWEWTGWHQRPTTQPAFAPDGHRIIVDGATYQEVRYSAFASNSREGEALLSLPPELAGRRRGGMSMIAAASAADSLPHSGEVAPGVHIVNVRGFNVMVVEFADFIALVEAPAVHPGFETISAAPTHDLGPEILQRVSTIAKGRPLRYVVITHHHSDHVGSIASIASGGTRVVTDAETGPVAERLLRNAPTERGARNARVQVVRDSLMIRDSTRSLVVYDVGANPHTSHNLFAWLPRERIGFQGDLYYYDAGMGAPPDRMVMNRFFSDWLARKKLDVRGTYGVHSAGAALPR